MKITGVAKTVGLAILAGLNTGVPARGMPRSGHIEGQMPLRGTPPAQGGIGDMAPERMDSINRWVDNPATKTGQYENRRVGAPVHPRNHGSLRHTPENVGRVFSGTGEIDEAAENLARMHKIQDVQHNTASVDGYKPTTAMKKEAERIIRHVDVNGRLPPKLPDWVDKPGAGCVKPKGLASASDEAVHCGGDVLGRGGKIAGKAARIAGPVALGVEVVVRGMEVKRTEELYRTGELGQGERVSRHAENAGGMAGGTAGAAAGAWAGGQGGAVVGTFIAGPLGAAIGATAGAIGGAIAGGVVGDTVGANGARMASEGIYGR